MTHYWFVSSFHVITCQTGRASASCFLNQLDVYKVNQCKAAVQCCLCVQLWNAVTGTHIATLAGHSKEVLDVCFDYAGQRIATASADGEWGAATAGECSCSIKHFVLSLWLCFQCSLMKRRTWFKTVDQAVSVALQKSGIKF